MSLADDVARLEAERDELRREVELLRGQQTRVGRLLYRRGYLTGYSAGQRKAAKETAPERHARGWARKALR